MNRCNHSRSDASRQGGVAMVEFAIIMTVFFVLVFGILEFAVAMFDWNRVVEATRAGARAAIVDNPACSGMANGVCPGACNPSATSPILARMRKIAPELKPSEVWISYQCTTLGASDRPEPIPVVTVQVRDVQHALFVPGLLGLPATITLPSFATTRTGEDMSGP